MYVEEAEDLGLGIAERVQDGAGNQRIGARVFWQLDDELHAQRPVLALRALELLVESFANLTDGPIRNDCEFCTDIHAGHEAVGGRTVFFYARRGEAYAIYCLPVKRGTTAGRPGQDRDEPPRHKVRGDP